MCPVSATFVRPTRPPPHAQLLGEPHDGEHDQAEEHENVDVRQDPLGVSVSGPPVITTCAAGRLRASHHESKPNTSTSDTLAASKCHPAAAAAITTVVFTMSKMKG